MDAVRILPKEHKIQHNTISTAALKVCRRLQEAGFEAYLVGGSVRDLLLGREPKDYDIATDAEPEKVRSVFRNSRIIGRRFRLVHVLFRNETIEVSTFRADARKPSNDRFHTDDGMILSDNVYGTLEEDAWRRDFTINAFYYDPSEDVVIDFVDGLKDLKAGIINTIGDPNERFQEDPIRIIRALRFAAKLDFAFSKEILKSINNSHALLEQVPGSRLYDAFLQVFFAGYALKMYDKLCEHNYFQHLFPETMELLAKPDYQKYEKLLTQALRSTDQRFHAGKSLNPGFLLSVILWPTLQSYIESYKEKGYKFYRALHTGMDSALNDHKASLLVLPARMVAMIRDVWVLQYYLQQKRQRRIFRIANDRYFRAAFDFLEMRVKLGEPLEKPLRWWAKFQNVSDEERQEMVDALEKPRK